jgi:hypothetical protein
MEVVGSVTSTKLDTGETLLTDESGQTWIWPAPAEYPMLNEIDPRIDLTQPIWEQVRLLAESDNAHATVTRSKPQPIKQ